jgi:glycosyltransferase involved in cell wall biosynthesis
VRKSILFIVPRLGVGGLELFLLRLAPKLVDSFDVKVVCIEGRGVLSREFKKANIEVIYLNLFSALYLPIMIFKLFFLIRKTKIDIIQTFLYPADFLMIILKLFLPKGIKIVWSIRSTSLPKKSKKLSRFLRFSIIKFSNRIPDKVISCSDEALHFHKSIGYKAKDIEIIPNFGPDWTINEKSKSCLFISENPQEVVLGLSARYTPGKGHDFICKVIELNNQDIKTRFKLKIKFTGLNTGKLGPLSEMIKINFPDIYSNCDFSGQLLGDEYVNWHKSIDLYVLCSDSLEGVPNTFLEASLIGTPVVGVNIGSSNLMATPDCLIPMELFTPEYFYNKIDFWFNLDIKSRIMLSNSNQELSKSNFNEQDIVEMYVNAYKNIFIS